MYGMYICAIVHISTYDGAIDNACLIWKSNALKNVYMHYQLSDLFFVCDRKKPEWFCCTLHILQDFCVFNFCKTM